jgi:hypothetical protein
LVKEKDYNIYNDASDSKKDSVWGRIFRVAPKGGSLGKCLS